MQAAMHFRRTSSGLTDSEGLLRAELHSRRSSPSWTGSEGLTASEALSEFYDSEAGEQHNVVNLRPHVKDISPISSTRSTEDGADQGQMRCAHNFRSKNRISATSCLDLHSRCHEIFWSFCVDGINRLAGIWFIRGLRMKWLG